MGKLDTARDLGSSLGRSANLVLAIGFGCAVVWSPTLVMAAAPVNALGILADNPPHGACMPALLASAIACATIVLGGEHVLAPIRRLAKPLLLGVVMALVGGIFVVSFGMQHAIPLLDKGAIALSGILVVVLYFLWMPALGKLSVRGMFLTLFFAQITTCVINTILVSVYTVLAASVLLPLVSVACLQIGGAHITEEATAEEASNASGRISGSVLGRLAIVVFVWGAVDHLFRGGFDALVRAQYMTSPIAAAYNAAAFVIIIVAICSAYALLAFKDRFQFGHLYRIIFLLGLASILLLPVSLTGGLSAAGYTCSVVMYQLVFLFMWVTSASVFRDKPTQAPRFFGIVYGCWSFGSFAGALFSSVLVQHLTVENAALTALVLALAVAAGYTTVFTERDANWLVQIVPFKRRAPFKAKCLAVAREHGLSPRETEIAMLIAQGRDSAHIEQKLYLSRSTVQTHRMHIYQKLDIHNRQELLDIIEQAEAE